MNRLLRSSVLFFLFQTICSSSYTQVNIATQHYNNDRTGWNNKETILNKSNVKAGSFGKLFAYPVDDQVYAQPLIIQNVNIPSVGIKNILYIATVNNSVYAFDADSFQNQPYWKKNFTPTNSRTITAADVQGGWCTVYNNITNNIGIIGTPVIDTTTNTIYFVSRSYELASRVYNQYLHAIDITTGNERSNSPVIIAAQINGNGDGSINGIVSFDARKNNQRPGLLLLNGVVYIGFSSHCDFGPYHGWLLGYDATTLQQKYVYNNTPDGSNGGIWMSGTGPAADAAGNIYIATGNGTVGSVSDPSNIRNRGESLLKLNPSGSNLSVQDFFTPNNYQYLESNDLDFGTSGTMIIPNSNRILAGCKDGNIYLLDQNNLGGYNATTNQSAQAVNLGGGANMHAQFSYYGGAANEYAYFWPENTLLTAIPFLRTTGLFDNTKIVTSSIPSPNGQTGAMLSVSSNGSLDSTAILWASVPSNCDAESNTCPGILRAIDAMDVTKEIWNSGTLSSDNSGSFAKFNSPVVANGKVYLSTFSNQVVVYGLLNSGIDSCQSSNLAFHKNAIASSSDNQQSGPGGAFDNDITTHWTSQTGDYAYLNVDLGKRYDICRILLKWQYASGESFRIESSDDLVNWKTLASVINNVSITNIIEVKGSGSVIRMLGYKQGTTNKYSINEFEVYGTADTTSYIPSTEKPVIYPNPASSLVHIAKGKDAIESISLYDITGRMVIQSNTTQGSLLVTLSITGLPAGIYVISIQTEKGVYRYKLLKASGR